MKEYQAKSDKSLTFEITQGSDSVGTLRYESWFRFNALIELAKTNKQFQVEPKGFWGTTIELKDSEKVFLKFKMNWNGQIVLQTFFDNNEQGYTFKHKGIFKETFLLSDQEGVELLAMKPHLKWNNMNYQYSITTTDGFETNPDKDLLLLTSLHCANYYMAMMTSVGIGG